MRTRSAVSALVALAATSAIGLGAGVVHSSHPSQASTKLTGSSWTLEASTDFGTTWQRAGSGNGIAQIPLQLDPLTLQTKPVYQPVSLRAAPGSEGSAHLTVGPAALLSGAPQDVTQLRVRMALSPSGTCSPAVVAGAQVSLLGAGGPVPVGTAPAPTPLPLDKAAPSVAGAPTTLCLEISAVAPVPANTQPVTLAWPVKANLDQN